eukprot:TRINITY_DN42067_c0_g1_i1.p1 TRINITY_DN42067_c0_g1~~TRINITY_DN42067_c0_g1_i1.p1  ORF type:complete len:345 (+),score=67.88 TRINITY_DN42067_c0_g1_i1:176-1210(+)
MSRLRRWMPPASVALVSVATSHFNKREYRPSKTRLQWRPTPVACQQAPAALPEASLVKRLRQDTEQLLAREGMASALEDAELKELFREVQVLVDTVDVISAQLLSGAVADAEATASARKAYKSFISALMAVNDAIFGPKAKPLTTTRAWAPLLLRWRYYVCSLFCWGLLTEESVLEVSSTLRSLGGVGVVDPLAGSGWQAHLWREVGGLDAVAMDAYEVRPVAWFEVAVIEDARNTTDWGLASESSDVARWALNLSWPPHSPETVGLDLLMRWPGDFLIFLGEKGDPGDAAEMGVTGGKSLLDAIDDGWDLVRTWSIPCWPGFFDTLNLYRRKPLTMCRISHDE